MDQGSVATPQFRLARARAVATATVGGDVGTFLNASMRELLSDALDEFAANWRARVDAIDAWSEVF
jgi:hypothetical protein